MIDDDPADQERIDFERIWGRLLEFLNKWSEAVEVGPGRIRVSWEEADGSTRDVEILMTPEEWEEMVGVMWGGFGRELRAHLKDTVLGLQPQEHFLVYGDYALYPQATEEVPVDPDLARLEELSRQHPEGFGEWMTYDRSGNPVYLRDFPEH
jgi:hypothetical protein